MASTPVDNEKLMRWYYAVNWGAMLLERHITALEAIDLDCTIHQEHLAALEDLKQFLDTSWNVWMYECAKTMEEGK